MKFILSAIFVQIIFLISVFDIHFQSPVVKGLIPHANPVPSPAKRLVLISADGLRFDTFLSFGYDREPNAPFLRSVAGARGKWGLSSTRVPTESRPGHVAMIAGLYEDPSAVFKGWKENPVEFDSVFNQSSSTFAFGSPDILNMFSKGNKRNVMVHSYSAESEQFTGHNAYKLDQWVFEQFERFIKAAPHNTTTASLMNQTHVIFFLHLLGLDTNGHTNKPHSTLYADNLRFVDDGIRRVEQLINEYYQDNATAFVFTSDHGMTDWGSHGAGHPTETRTPLVVWGAGVNTKGIDAERWQDQRIDVEQADITPLMAALLGIHFPVNSVGKLPLNYLSDKNKMWQAEAMLTNAKQLRSSFEALSDRQRDRSLSWRFRPYEPLESSRLGLDHVRQIERSIHSGFYDESIKQSLKLMDSCLQGTDYFYRYDQFQLKSCITLAYLGWTAILAVLLIQDRLKAKRTHLRGGHRFQIIDHVAFALSILIFIILTVEKSPVLYYTYHLLPLVLWWYSFRQSSSLIKTIHLRWRYFAWSILLLLGIELLVAAFFLPLVSFRGPLLFGSLATSQQRSK